MGIGMLSDAVAISALVPGGRHESNWLTEYDSYVKPNSKCPECGASVFFYQSEHERHVFFDELGPPWPERACHRPFTQILRCENAGRRLKAGRNGMRDGWQPFAISRSANITRYVHIV